MSNKYSTMTTMDLIAARDQILAKGANLSANDAADLSGILAELNARAQANKAQALQEQNVFAAGWKCATAAPKMLARGISAAEKFIAQVEPAIEPAAEAFGRTVQMVVYNADACVRVMEMNALGLKNVKDVDYLSYEEKRDMRVEELLK